MELRIGGYILLPFLVNFTITGSEDECYLTDIELEINPEDYHPAVTYDWDFGSGATPLTATGPGPHIVNYSTSGAKNITVTATNGTHELIVITPITINSCPGNITGKVRLADGTPIAGAVVRLYADTNADGVLDGAILGSSVTGGTGDIVFVNRTPGNYILHLATIPAGYAIASESFDTGLETTPNEAPNLSLTDRFIPVTLGPSEVDTDNDFILQPV